MLGRISALLSKNGFLRNVGILTIGTVAAQGIMALTLPILTRLYSPEDFSFLAIYTSLLSLLTVASCLRYNIAIPLPADDREAWNLLMLSLLSGAAVAVASAIPVVFAPHHTAQLLGQPRMRPLLWLIPVGVFLAASYDALQYWASRKRRFGLITQTRLTRAAGGAGSQLMFGFASPSPFGLIFGHMLYSGLGVVGLIASAWRRDRESMGEISAGQLVRTAKQYGKFPLFSVPEALFNTAGVELSILIIAATAAGPEAGFMMLAMRVMGLPMTLVGSSVGQIYLTEAPERFRGGNLPSFTRRTMWALLKAGALPLALVGTTSPLIFPLIFGTEWARAGVIVAWLTPLFIVQFVASPVSMIFHVVGRLAWAMWLQIFGGVLRVGALLIAARAFPDHLVETFAISGTVFYLVSILFVSVALRRLCPE